MTASQGERLVSPVALRSLFAPSRTPRGRHIACVQMPLYARKSGTFPVAKCRFAALKCFFSSAKEALCIFQRASFMSQRASFMSPPCRLALSQCLLPPLRAA